jgi:hypothetical protein
MLISCLRNERGSAVEGRWVWDGGERERWQRVLLQWHGALAREEAKWRRGWVVGRVTKVVGVGLSGESGRQWWCRFNASVLFWEEGGGMKHCQKMKQRQWARLGPMGRKSNTVRRCGDVGRRRGGTREETTPVGLTQILLGKKWRKFTRSIQLLQLDDEDLKQWWVNLIFLKIYANEI